MMALSDAASGARDRLVTIQQLTESTGGSRYPVETWTDVATVWAYRDDGDVGERFVENQQTAPYTTRWTIPWMSSMDPDLVNVPKDRRLVVKGRVYEITGAKELGRRGGIELTTMAGGLLT